MKHVSSQQGKTPSQTHGAAPTPPVSTPFSTSHAHAAFSPLGPRSSPQQFKKSPANSATLMGHSVSSGGGGSGGGGGGGGNGVGGPSSVPMTYDSPAAAAMGALGGSGGLDLGALDHVSVGGLGALSVMGRNDEDERAKRLQTVLQMLKHNAGRVTEAGLERLTKSMGLECMWEEGLGANKARTLIIAGSALAIEIVVPNNIVQSVSVTFPESHNIVLRHVERANDVLLEDLKLLPHESPLTKKLDAFAAHLETLAVLDKLSVEPGLNLYEAVAGIYETLHRLFHWDLQKLRADPAQSGKPEDVLERTVQCARHGRPAMHENGRLGLSLLYWQDMRLVRPQQAQTTRFAAAREKTWAILVGCAPMGPHVFQPVRVSDKWLSAGIEKDTGEGGDGDSDGRQPVLDWLEPENTILPSSTGTGAAGAAGADGKMTDDKSGGGGDGDGVTGAKLPEVVFHAVLDPPVVVPYSVWHHISESVGLVLEPETLVTFDVLSFPMEPGSQHDPSELRTITCDREVYYRPRGSGAAPAIRHRHTLFVYKPVYGRTVAELPFPHPSRLVDLLPTLRQYAFLATVLEKAFGTTMASILPEAPAREGQGRTAVTSTVEDEFAAFTRGEERQPGEGVAEEEDGTTLVDVVLTAHPVPRLQVVFPFRSGTADIMLEIGLNAQVRVVSQNIFGSESEAGDDNEDGKDGKEGPEGPEGHDGHEGYEGHEGHKPGKGRRLDPQDLGRMLEVCEDLGVWSEWIRTRCA